MPFKIGDQIVYIPTHAEDMLHPGAELSHPDTEFGFITGFNSIGTPFCRYWSNLNRNVLRTTANSECTPIHMLKKYALKPQTLIYALLPVLGYNINYKGGENMPKRDETGPPKGSENGKRDGHGGGTGRNTNKKGTGSKTGGKKGKS